MYIRSLWPCQLGKLQGAELKINKLKLALNGQSLAHIRACELKLALFTTWVDSNPAVEGGN